MPDFFSLMRALRSADLTHTDYRVLTTIASYADPDLTNAFPSQSLIAEACRMRRENVARSIRRLAAAGWLTVTEQGGNGTGYRKRNVYAVVIPKGITRGQSAETDVVEGDHTGTSKGITRGHEGDHTGATTYPLTNPSGQLPLSGRVGTGPSPAHGREQAHETTTDRRMVAVARPQAAVAAVEARSYADPVVQNGLRRVCAMVGGWTSEVEEHRATELLAQGVPWTHVGGEVEAARDTAAIRADLAADDGSAGVGTRSHARELVGVA